MDLFGISKEMTSLGSNGKDAQLSAPTEQDRYNFLPNVDFQNLNISFNGCGFLGIYHIGVATALKTYVPDFRIENISGASAGAVAAVCLLGGVETGKHNISFFINCYVCVNICLYIKLAITSQNHISDQCALAILDTVVECRKLLGGPFNPSFDPCKHFEDILHKVSVQAIILQS